jgi:hypothetical protein
VGVAHHVALETRVIAKMGRAIHAIRLHRKIEMDREIIVAVVVGNQCCASLLSLGDDAVLLVYLNGGIAQCRFFPLCDSIVVTDDTCTWAQGNLVRFVLPPLMLFVYESHHQLSSGRFHPRNLLLRD